MTEFEHKAEKQSRAYNKKYSEDRNLEDVLKHPEKYVDSYAYTMRIVQMLRQKAYRDGYNAGAKEMQEEIEQLKLINKKMQCCKNCKKYRMLESQVPLRCLKNRRINFCCEEWEFEE